MRPQSNSGGLPVPRLAVGGNLGMAFPITLLSRRRGDVPRGPVHIGTTQDAAASPRLIEPTPSSSVKAPIGVRHLKCLPNQWRVGVGVFRYHSGRFLVHFWVLGNSDVGLGSGLSGMWLW